MAEEKNKTQATPVQSIEAKPVVKPDPRKSPLPLNKVYNFTGGAVAQSPNGLRKNEAVKADKVRITSFTPESDFPFEARSVDKGFVYGFVAQDTLTEVK